MPGRSRGASRRNAKGGKLLADFIGAAAKATGGFFFRRIANQSLKRMIAIRTAILEDRHGTILVKIGAAFNAKQKHAKTKTCQTKTRVRIVKVGAHCFSLSLLRGRGLGEGVAATKSPSPLPSPPSWERGTYKQNPNTKNNPWRRGNQPLQYPPMQPIVYAILLLVLSPFLLLLAMSLIPVIAAIFLVWCVGKSLQQIFAFGR